MALAPMSVRQHEMAICMRRSHGSRCEPAPRRPLDETALGAFLACVGVLDFPDQAALDYTKIRADLQKKGTTLGANDLFIAADARSLGLTVVTNNTREFRRVPHLTQRRTGR